jgi:cell fate regulator YaaT (PSP1 superfamily)
VVLRPGDDVVVATEDGPRVGRVVVGPRPRVFPVAPPRVVRRASESDVRARATARSKEEEAFRFCTERIRALGLDMKLIRVDVLPGGGKAVFHFCSDHRVDFRELVANLARQLHCRVEMRQVGVRDAARVLGGLGVCGRELCCASCLRRFAPVSIRMAKDQGLALNPQKVSGQCGRLLCCLNYEQQTYHALRAGLPRAGKPVTTADGRRGRVKDVDVLRGSVRVVFDTGVEEFTREAWAKAAGAPVGALPSPAEEDDAPEGGHDGGGGASPGGAPPPPSPAPAPPSPARDRSRSRRRPRATST